MPLSLDDVTSPLASLPTIHPWQIDAIGLQLANRNIVMSSAASAAWPAASMAIYWPFRVADRRLWDVFVYNGNASNSVDAGVYTWDWTRLNSMGLQSRTGASVIQRYTTGWELRSGSYYFAVCINGTTGGTFSLAPAAEFMRGWGVSQEDLSGAGTPGTLPNPATPAPMAQSYMPIAGLVMSGYTI